MANKSTKLLFFVCVLITLFLFSWTANAFLIIQPCYIGDEAGCTCECDSCEDCTNALNSTSCKNIKLQKNISISSETCINSLTNFLTKHPFKTLNNKHIILDYTNVLLNVTNKHSYKKNVIMSTHFAMLTIFNKSQKFYVQ